MFFFVCCTTEKNLATQTRDLIWLSVLVVLKDLDKRSTSCSVLWNRFRLFSFPTSLCVGEFRKTRQTFRIHVTLSTISFRPFYTQLQLWMANETESEEGPSAPSSYLWVCVRKGTERGSFCFSCIPTPRSRTAHCTSIISTACLQTKPLPPVIYGDLSVFCLLCDLQKPLGDLLSIHSWLCMGTTPFKGCSGQCPSLAFSCEHWPTHSVMQLFYPQILR